MSNFNADTDANWLIVKNTLYSQPGNVPIRLSNGQGISNPGERSHGLDTAQVHDFLVALAEYFSAQATQGGVVLTSTVMQNAVNAAKNRVLTGQRDFTFSPSDSNFANVQAQMLALKGHDVKPFLFRFVEYLCQQTSNGGVTITAMVISTALSVAKGALVGNRSF
jgi:hypothetical protein